MLEVKSRTTHSLRIRWTLPSGVANLFAQAGYPAAPDLKLADLVVFLDGVASAFVKVSEQSPGVVFDVNINSLRTKFRVEAILFRQLSNFFTEHRADEIENPLANLPPPSEVSDYILHREYLDVSLTQQGLTCEVYSKSAKIDADFYWTGELDEGIDTVTAMEIYSTWKTFKPFYWDDKLLLGIRFDEELASEDAAFETKFHEALLTPCPCPKFQDDFTFKKRSDLKCLADAPTVVSNAAPGATVYRYIVVAVFPGGRKSGPSPPGTLATGPAALGAGVWVEVSWDAVPGAVEYEVYRLFPGDTASMLPGCPTTATSIKDLSNSSTEALATNANFTYPSGGPGISYTWTAVGYVSCDEPPFTVATCAENCSQEGTISVS